MATLTTLQKKSLDRPDEVREFDSGRLELVTIGDMTCGRAEFQPGWRWSQHVKPIAQTESCQFPHKGYIVSGTMHVRMDDGAELDVTEGDVVVIAPGHDAWVVGDEPCIMFDFGQEDTDYAKPVS